MAGNSHTHNVCLSLTHSDFAVSADITANLFAALHAAASNSTEAELRFACSQMVSHRVQGLALTGVVFVIVIVVLTVVQAAKHDWFVYKGA